MDYRSKGALLVAGAFLIATPFLSAAPSVAQIPEAIAVPGEIPAALLHAEGAQIYQCAAGPHDQLGESKNCCDRGGHHGR